MVEVSRLIAKVSADISDAERNLKKIQAELNQTASTANDAGEKTGKKLSGIAGYLKPLDDKLKDTTGGLVSLGSVGSMALLGVGAAAGTMAVKFGSEAVGASARFEAQMSAVKAVSGATTQDIAALSETAMRLGPAWGMSAAEVGSGMEELTKAGISTQDILSGMEATMSLAAAGGVSMAQAAEVAATSINVFNLKGSDMAHVADLMAGAANASIISVEDLRQSLAMTSSVAAMAGQSIDGTTTAIGLMGQAGIKNSDAGTSLKQFLLSLTPASKQAADQMRELGIITEDGANKFYDSNQKMKSWREIAQVLQDATRGLSDQQRDMAMKVIFGSDAIRAGNVLLKAGADGYDEFYAAMSKTSAIDVAKTRIDNLAGSQKKLNAEWENFLINIGNQAAPMLKGITDATTGLLHATNESMTAQQAYEQRLKELLDGGMYEYEQAVYLARMDTQDFVGSLENVNRTLPDTAAAARDAAAAVRTLRAELERVVTTGGHTYEDSLKASDLAQAYGHPEGWGDRPSNAGLEYVKQQMREYEDQQNRLISGSSSGASAVDRQADALASLGKEAKQTARDMEDLAGATEITVNNLEQDYGDRWIAKLAEIQDSIQQVTRDAQKAIIDLWAQDQLNQDISNRRAALDAALSDKKKAHDRSVELDELAWQKDYDLRRESDADARKRIEEQYQQRIELLMHQREIEDREAAWVAENITKPQAALEAQLHDEEMQRRKAAIEAESQQKIDKLNAEWAEWQRVEREKTDEAKELAREKAAAELLAMQEEFSDKLAEANQPGMEQYAEMVANTLQTALSRVIGSGGGGGGDSSDPNAGHWDNGNYVDPNHQPGGAAFEEWKQNEPEQYAEWEAEHRASGGPVYAGMPYLVGERGPELFVPRSSGRVVPNDSIAKPNISASVVINSPQPLSPSSIRRQTERMLRSLALEYGL